MSIAQQIRDLIESKPKSHWIELLKKYSPDKITYANGLRGSTSSIKKEWGKHFDLRSLKTIRNQNLGNTIDEKTKQFIRDNYKTMSQPEIAKATGATKNQIQQFRQRERLGIKSKEKASQNECMEARELTTEYTFKPINKSEHVIRGHELGFI